MREGGTEDRGEALVRRVRVGLVGSGFAAALHADAYRRVCGVEVEIVAVASRRRDRAEAFAGRYGIPAAVDDPRILFDDPGIEVIDLCVPNGLHEELAVAAARAAKHVICEKPLTAFCGEAVPEDAGDTVPREQMLDASVAGARRMTRAAASSGVRLMYAENWVYAPSVQKACRLMAAGRGAILDIRAEESHSGSHSPFSKRWKHAGGGSLLRLGAHPIGAALYLKRKEAEFRDVPPIGVRSVTAEVARLTRLDTFRDAPKGPMVSDWEDVEDWACAILTFTDGTKATILSTDVMLGGIRNRMEIGLSNARIECRINPNTSCLAYAPDGEVFGDEYITEKLGTKAGWSFPSPDEEWFTGYPQEIQDFVECVAFDRPPVSDGSLGEEVVRVLYAAYLAAERGERVLL